ncbi:MAG: alpha/beta hydrolase [Sandaracinaceae bacterium]|nr:alpha/beta hydrolase [Sandaracinaceae bacterium]
MGASANLETSDGARLVYRTFGDRGRSLVLVHGWMTSGAVFDDLVAALEGARLRIVVPDLVGSGASSRPETGHELLRFAADVLAVIEHAGLERPVVLGHSMGGQIAQLVAAAMTDLAGLVLVNPVPLGGLTLPDDARGLFSSAAGDAGKLGTILDLATVALAPADKARLVEVAMSVSEASIVESLEAWTTGGLVDRLDEVRAPTLVVATDDPFLPRELLQAEVADRIAGARLAHLPGAGHYPSVEKPAELAALIRGFLDAIDP